MFLGNYAKLMGKNNNSDTILTGMALLKFKEMVVQDPFNALSNWNVEDGILDHCLWFGVHCSDGNVVVLYVPHFSPFYALN